MKQKTLTKSPTALNRSVAEREVSQESRPENEAPFRAIPELASMGYINKEEATPEIINAIRRILGGEICLSSRMSNRLLNGVAGRSDVPGQSSIMKFSDREMEVFGLIGQGSTISLIAEHLHLSIKTIKTHREYIKKKLNLETANELVRLATQWMIEQIQSHNDGSS